MANLQSLQDRLRFDAILHPQRFGPPEVWDTVLLKRDNFVVVPSKGSLVPGWLLVIPTEDVLACARLSSQRRQALEQVALAVSEKVSSAYGPCYWFEHGAAAPDSVMGCGVDHAHLHIVPLPFDLLAVLESRADPGVVWSTPTILDHPLSVLTFSHSYMFVRAPDGRTITSANMMPQSQYLRKVIADALGVPKKWHYERFPYRANAEETVRRLGPLLRDHIH